MVDDGGPDPEWVEWAAARLGGDGRTANVRSLRAASGPWLVEAGDGSAVLRGGAGADEIEKIRTDVEALRFVADHGIPAPGVLAHTADDERALELIELVDGDSAVPRDRDDERLGRFGAVLARIAALRPPTSWKLRSSPIESTDFEGMLRDSPHPLLQRGRDALAGLEPAPTDEGVVHGDMWHGNTLWRDDELVATIDWDHAGRGPAGIDLGAVRFDSALYFGVGAEDAVLAGWEREAGRAASDVAYWDLVAAVASPPDLAWFVPTIIADGRRPDLDRPTLIGRRDGFLEAALRRLDA
jgi:aminoglycoside phosphotransferase (APT) family kinase protein